MTLEHGDELDKPTGNPVTCTISIIPAADGTYSYTLMEDGAALPIRGWCGVGFKSKEEAQEAALQRYSELILGTDIPGTEWTLK
jgi:hypothetical protein